MENSSINVKGKSKPVLIQFLHYPDHCIQCHRHDTQQHDRHEQPVHLERLAKEQELQRNVLATDVERWLDREEASSNLEIILKLLTDRERMVYDAYFEQNLSLKETVELTGLSANAVRSAIDRIRQRAKRFFHISIIIFSIRCIFHISRTM